jgi:hypothetical protein
MGPLALGLGLAACSGAKDSTPAAPLASATSSEVRAVVAVERAMVFPLPDRNAEPLTYLYQRERPVRGQTADSVFLLTTGMVRRLILRAQWRSQIWPVPQVTRRGAVCPPPSASPNTRDMTRPPAKHFPP